jgi:putative hydrolase of the HAD superfamily
MGLVLVFDADDTLWENNIRFNRVIADYVAWLTDPVLDEASIRAVLRDVEVANTAAHGYGSRVFLRTLADCFERLRARPATAAERRRIEELAVALVEHRVELVPSVAETLRELGSRHRLVLLTKGVRAEQQGKLDASGLAGHFTSIHIVDEKDVATYRRLTTQLRLDPATTWMIGNSPKSDVLPARGAGWNAVFIPNEHTWALELDQLAPDDRVLELRRFTDLLEHF